LQAVSKSRKLYGKEKDLFLSGLSDGWFVISNDGFGVDLQVRVFQCLWY
jgi:hypothetical protein